MQPLPGLRASLHERLSPAARPFLRHILACNNASLPGRYKPLFCAGERIGWITPEILARLRDQGSETPEGIALARGELLQPLGETLIARNLCPAFNELFDVRDQEGRVIGQIDRGAIPLLGLTAEGVHLNGLVMRAGAPYLWTARRSLHKRLDPGKMDHLVAGGMNAGLTPQETLLKEAQEEAGIPPALSRQARPVGRLYYRMERPEGLRRDLLHCYDLALPEDFQPVATDGEVESFHLLPLEDVFTQIRDTDDFKFNVTLVLIDLFLRYGLFRDHDSALLRQALDEGSF